VNSEDIRTMAVKAVTKTLSIGRDDAALPIINEVESTIRKALAMQKKEHIEIVEAHFAVDQVANLAYEDGKSIRQDQTEMIIEALREVKK